MSPTAWTIAFLFLLLGAAVAAAVTWYLMRRSYGDRESASRLRNELEAYRGEVRDHFVETARRVDALTHAYKEVYDHLEGGAYRLVGEAELRERLEDAKSEPVTIEGIGQRRLGAGADSARREGSPRPHEARASDEALGYRASSGAAATPGTDEEGIGAERVASEEENEPQPSSEDERIRGG